MAVDIRQRDKPASLSVQVTLAEQRLLARRQMVRSRISTLGQNLHSQISSPAALLWAGGLGFAAAEFTRRLSRAPANAERPRAPPSKLFDRALKLMALVRTLSSAFPSADRYPNQEDVLD
jgi:hypothetical protein